MACGFFCTFAVRKRTIKYIMKKRQTITTEGKRISFFIDDNYYLPGKDLSLVFNGYFSKSKYCVLYTGVFRDSGEKWVNNFGVPALERYDNGVIGGQNFNFYDNKEEALRDYEMCQKLTPKPLKSVFAYADVMLVENIK